MLDQSVRSRSALQPHLTISYSATSPGTGSAAAAGGTGAPSVDSPLGFLAALVDQLLTGATADTQAAGDGPAPASPAATTAAPATPATSLGTVVAALLGTRQDGAAADSPAPVAPTVPSGGAPLVVPLSATAASETASDTVRPAPHGNVLMAQLTRQLQKLRQQLDQGEQPDPELLRKIGETAEALTALIAAPATSAPPLVAPVAPAPDQTGTAAALDPLAAIGSTSKATTGMPASGGSPEPATQPNLPAALPDQAKQFLASLGFDAAPSPASATPSGNAAQEAQTRSQAPTAPATSAQPNAAPPPLPDIAQLVTKLDELGASIAPAAPEVAQKLEALAQKLDAAQTDPAVLAQVTTATDPDAKSLDAVVQTLLGPRPTATAGQAPQLAATAQLQVPAPIAPEAPKAATTESLPAAPAPLADSTSPLKVAAAKPHADATPDPKPEAKIVAEIAAKNTDSADPTGSTPQSAAPAAAPAATPAPRVVPAAYQAASNAINMAQVAFEMVRQVHQGQSRFSIRLDPPELGRVDVRMHVDASGTVNARLTVERAETLDMFQRDRGTLEKALTQSGLDAGKTNLEFSLKQNPFAGMAGSDQRSSGGQGFSRQFVAAPREPEDALAVPAVTLYRGTISAAGVNLFV